METLSPSPGTPPLQFAHVDGLDQLPEEIAEHVSPDAEARLAAIESPITIVKATNVVDVQAIK